MIAWELQLQEEEPPYASFANRGLATAATRLPSTRLVSESWMDAVLSRLREIDETVERRKKLDKTSFAGTPAYGSPAGGQPAREPKGRGKTQKVEAAGKAPGAAPQKQ